MTGNRAKPRHLRYSKAFTIVELLIVIVVIAILAAITIIAYNGIANRAKQSAAASAAESAAKKVLSYASLNSDAFPSSLAVAGISNDANTVFEYTYDDTAKTYCITATFQNVSYYTSNVNGGATAGKCAGHSGGLPTWTQVAGGYNGTCGTYGGKAYCWGDNGYGQVGNNSTTGVLVPTAVVTSGVLSGLSIVDTSYGRGAGGDTHSCAIATNGNLYCWGNGVNGKLGNGATANSSVPVAVTMSGVLSGKTVTSLSTAQGHSCVLASSNVYCWGENQNGYGDLGNGSAASSSVPVAVTTSGVLSGKTVTKLSKAKGLFNCVIASGAAYCWGFNYFGYLGNNSTSDSNVPVAVNTAGVLSGKTVTDIAVGGEMACALANGAPYCWGYGATGNLGNSANSNSSVPVAVTTSGVLAGKTITSIVAGNSHTCVLADGAPYCWGSNDMGQLGNGVSGSSSNVPVAVNVSGVLAGKTITSLAGGSRHTCAVASGDLYCWGNNGDGQLGNNSTTSSSVPVKVTNP